MTVLLTLKCLICNHIQRMVASHAPDKTPLCPSCLLPLTLRKAEKGAPCSSR